MSTESKLPINFYSVIKYFQRDFPDAALTGTCALLHFGFDMGRNPTDIDFIMPKKPKETKDYSWQQFNMPSGFTAKGYSTIFNNTRIEVIVWDEWEFQTVGGIKVTKLENLLEAKRDLGMTGTLKHIDDFWKITKQLLAGYSAHQSELGERVKELEGEIERLNQQAGLITMKVTQCPICFEHHIVKFP